MFVRWKSKLLVQRQDEILPDRLKYAQLVETSWKTGKPRQKVIKYLASIRESQMESPELYPTKTRNINWNIHDCQEPSEDR
jgi:hypothetical protein